MIDQRSNHSLSASLREAERKREADEKSTAWAFVWTLFVFKIVTILATFWAAAGSLEAGVILLATNWFWMALPVFAIAGPLAFHYRKRKVRRRRAAMVRSEWMVE
jgi:cation transport ATPase